MKITPDSKAFIVFSCFFFSSSLFFIFLYVHGPSYDHWRSRLFQLANLCLACSHLEITCSIFLFLLKVLVNVMYFEEDKTHNIDPEEKYPLHRLSFPRKWRKLFVLKECHLTSLLCCLFGGYNRLQAVLSEKWACFEVGWWFKKGFLNLR